MTDTWRVRRVEDLAEIYDGPHATPHKTQTGPWFLSISSLQRGRLVLEESAHLSEDDFAVWTRRVTPRPGDILFSYETRLGEAALMPTGLRACLGRRMAILRPRADEINPRFLLYAYLGPAFQSEIEQRAVRGATVDRIPLVDLGRWPIFVPDRPTQDGIAEVLGTLDDKIDNCSRVAARADELFHAEWERRFGHLQDGPNRRLSEVCSTQYGYTASASANSVGPKFLRVMDINKSNWINWNGVPYCVADDSVRARYGLKNGDLVVARMADPGKAALVEANVDAVFASYLVRLVPHRSKESLFLFGFLKSIYYEQYARSHTTGSVQKNMNAKVIVGASLFLPSPEEIAHFNAWGEPIRGAITTAVAESAAAVYVRDALLAPLLSGELGVRGAEALVGEAV